MPSSSDAMSSRALGSPETTMDSLGRSSGDLLKQEVVNLVVACLMDPKGFFNITAVDATTVSSVEKPCDLISTMTSVFTSFSASFEPKTRKLNVQEVKNFVEQDLKNENEENLRKIKTDFKKKRTQNIFQYMEKRQREDWLTCYKKLKEVNDKKLTEEQKKEEKTQILNHHNNEYTDYGKYMKKVAVCWQILKKNSVSIK